MDFIIIEFMKYNMFFMLLEDLTETKLIAYSNDCYFLKLLSRANQNIV